MNQFWLYLRLGLEHITDLGGYDHILFILALTAGYSHQHWRQLLWLVTAFTLGHSITLALATVEVIQVSRAWVEFCIPLTIIVTCLSNIHLSIRGHAPGASSMRYAMATVFGLVHGLGFSNYLRSLLGRGSDIVGQLLAFNLGLELGQLVVVLLVLVLGGIFVYALRGRRQLWVGVLSVCVLLAAARLAILTYPT